MFSFRSCRFVTMKKRISPLDIYTLDNEYACPFGTSIIILSLLVIVSFIALVIGSMFDRECSVNQKISVYLIVGGFRNIIFYIFLMGSVCLKYCIVRCLLFSVYLQAYYRKRNPNSYNLDAWPKKYYYLYLLINMMIILFMLIWIILVSLEFLSTFRFIVNLVLTKVDRLRNSLK